MDYDSEDEVDPPWLQERTNVVRLLEHNMKAFISLFILKDVCCKLTYMGNSMLSSHTAYGWFNVLPRMSGSIPKCFQYVTSQNKCLFFTILG